ncbi:formylglycine-generating enzyme family protein [Peribacillus frigoritolerans]
MSKEIMSYIDYPMVKVPGGEIELRIKSKWKAEIRPFLLAISFCNLLSQKAGLGESYSIIGNVWEWYWDIYDEQVYGAYRIFRGGSWAEDARGCGASCRRRSHPAFCIDDLGFRLARSF